jgi:PAS domain S-box-containing protein
MDIPDYTFKQLFDVEELEKICQKFSNLTGAATAILGLEGNIIVESGWQPICSQFHRINNETNKICIVSDTILTGELQKGKKYNIHKCENGLIDVAIPIFVANNHIANLFTGQFLNESPDIDAFKKQAKKYNFDEQKYLAALDEVLIYSDDQIKNTINFLVQLTETIGNIGLKNLENIENVKNIELEKTKLEAINKKLNKAKEQVEESEKRYQSLSDSSFESIFISENGICIDQNKKAEVMFGYTLSEAIGKPGIDWISPEYRKIVTNNIISNYEEPYKADALTKNGSVFPCEIQAINTKHKGTKVRITALRDITEVVEKGNELEMIINNMSRSFALHEMIFDENGVPVDYVYIRINDAFVNTTGLDYSIIGKKATEVLGDDASEWIKIYSQLFIKDKPLHFEKYVDIFNSWYLLDIYKQNSIRFVSIFEDISEIKLKESQHLDIINSTLSSSYLADKEGVIVAVNDRCCKYFKQEREELIGSKVVNVLVDNDSKEYKRKKTLEAIFTGEAVHFINTENGNFFENYIYPIMDKRGSIEYVAVHIKDITEQENIKIELEKAKNAAEKSDISKSLFLANMSHELKTPMNGVIGYSDMLLDSDYNGDELVNKKYLKVINVNAKHLEELLNNILDYAKIEAGELDLDLFYEKFSINELFEELEDLLQDTNDKKNVMSVKLTFEKREDDDIIISDYLRLKQVLYNLVNNAIKFTELGHIRVGTRILDNIITFFVEDTGIGIHKDKLEIVFDKFVQVDTTSKKKYQGTGLGLSIAKSIIKILGGIIWVDSTENQGSTFFFTLPKEEKNIEQKEKNDFII